MSFAESFKTFSADGRISIRRAQFQSANKGNTSMLIWLGKQYLGQKEQQEITLDRSADDTINKMNEYFFGSPNPEADKG